MNKLNLRCEIIEGEFNIKGNYVPSAGLEFGLQGHSQGFEKGFDQIFSVGSLLNPSQIQLGGLGSTVSSPSRVWGRAPDAHEFGAFQTKKEAFSAIYITTF